jgi:hypothetical protein
MYKKIIKNQQGAIFGVDARIAIAIFALLSVTAGNFALGKLEKVRNGAILKELQNIDFAMQQFQTDMGVFYGHAIGENNGLDDFKALYQQDVLKRNFKKLWNGPYIDEETNIHSILGRYYIAYYKDDMSPCETKGECFTFIAVTETPLEAWTFINTYKDESLGTEVEKETTKHLTGKVRSLNLNSEKVTLLYKSVSRKRR